MGAGSIAAPLRSYVTVEVELFVLVDEVDEGLAVETGAAVVSYLHRRGAEVVEWTTGLTERPEIGANPADR